MMTRYGAALIRKLPNDSILSVYRVGKAWHWSAVTADGGEARYSRPFATEREARVAAVLFANQVELASTGRASTGRA
jgi:hypothetical protein